MFFDHLGRKDALVRYLHLPSRIVWKDPGSGTITTPEALLVDGPSGCTLSPGSGTGPAVLIDFGQELNGGICLDVIATEPAPHAKVRIRFGESASEAMGQPDRDHAIHDYILDLPCVSRQEIGTTGFRFVRLDLLDNDSRVSIRQIKAVAVERELDYKGSFESSDPLLNKIWMVGARTVHLCCQEYLLDGIKRDRMVWMGDAHMEIQVIAQVFGDIDIVPATLGFIRDNTPPGHWMNGLSSYSFWWILNVWEWYGFTGNLNFLKSQVPFLKSHIEHIIARIDSDGRPDLGEPWFLEWSLAKDKTATREAVTVLCFWALTTAEKIFHFLGDLAMSNTCQDACRRLMKSITFHSTCKQIHALRILTGMAEAGAVNEAFLTQDPYHGFSPWFAYYILKARALAGDHHRCLDIIRTYWGGMLKLGATSFWEHFDLDWLKDVARIDELTPPGKHDVHAEYGDHCYKGLRHSLCHGWGGAPTAWLSQEVLGVLPLSPGFKTVRIEPHLGDLTFAQGAVPTPLGIISVIHTRDADGQTKTKYAVPDGVCVVNNEHINK